MVASHTAMFREEEEKNTRDNESTSGSSNTVERTTLGDIDVLAELKERMEKGK